MGRVCGFLCIVTVSLGLAAVSPRAGRPVLVIARDGQLTAVLAAIGRSGGSLIALGSNPARAVAISAEPGFVDRLYAAGALLVIDAGRPELCSGRS